MGWIIFYLAIALISMSCDGMLCFVAKRRYMFWASLRTCLVWPITAPIEIAAAVIATRKFERWDKPSHTENE